MTEASKVATKKPPKGGRKGGTQYPHLNLQKALEYAKRLVSKTHTGAQPEDEILPGVFGNSGPVGQVRASALKQFGLMEGTPKAYQATKLARDIEAALPDGRPALMQQAVLNSKIFDKIFDTFHGDTVSKAQVAKRAKELEVHPDSADECAQLFIESVITSGLGNMEGESIRLVNVGTLPAPATDAVENNRADEIEMEEPPVAPKPPATSTVSKNGIGTAEPPPANRGSKPGLNVSLNVDSSSDPDKLEKQLKLLREYGVI